MSSSSKRSDEEVTRGQNDNSDIIESSLSDTEEEDMLVSQLNVDITNQYVVFSVGNEEYGVPILTVQEIISMPSLTRIPGVPDYIPGIINLRGNVIPLYILRSKFNLDIEDQETESVVIIIQIDDNKTVGMIVDSVSDVASITEENLRETPDFSGAVDVKFVEKLGQIGNRIIIILSLANFFSDTENSVLENTMKMGEKI